MAENNSDNDNQNIHAEMAKKNARLGLTVLAVVIGMACMAYAAVPLYSLFCRVTGFGGTTQVAESLPDTVLERTVIVQFNADINRKLHWDFEPEQRSIEVHLGQRGLTAYKARNKLSKSSAGSALYNVTPLKVGKYFHKVQCFCFDTQTLEPAQEVSMPVMFYVDPAMNDDPNMNDVTTITLSYTFYPADSEELEDGLEAFYNTEN